MPENNEAEKLEEIDLSTRLSRNPAIWFGLILIPVFIGIVLGFMQGGAEEGAEVPVAAVVAAEKQEAALAEPKVIESGRRGQPVGAVSCDFNIWLGRPLNEGLVAEQLQAMNRPYRILPPGSMMTMDYSPSRVNFELDENGVVKRIFCG